MIPKQPIKIQINDRLFSAGDDEVDADGERARVVDGCVLVVIWGCGCTLIVDWWLIILGVVVDGCIVVDRLVRVVGWVVVVGCIVVK